MRIIENRELFEKFKLADRDPLFFVEEYYRQRRNTKSNISAYDRVEELHQQVTGCRRYSDFESFRRTRRRIKNR
jgi:hypothetical protein